MRCVLTVSYSVNFNGDKVGHIIPTRGIRQGEPMSSYLFLFCVKTPSNLLRNAIHKKELIGVKISRIGPVVYHFFFADDLLIFL